MNHYRENDYSSSSSDESTNTSLDGDGVGHQEESSGDESTNEADDGSAKQFYLHEKRHGSVLREKAHEHIPLLRAMAIGLEDDVRQDDRFNECMENIDLVCAEGSCNCSFEDVLTAAASL